MRIVVVAVAILACPLSACQGIPKAEYRAAGPVKLATERVYAACGAQADFHTHTNTLSGPETIQIKISNSWDKCAFEVFTKLTANSDGTKRATSIKGKSGSGSVDIPPGKTYIFYWKCETGTGGEHGCEGTVTLSM